MNEGFSFMLVALVLAMLLGFGSTPLTRQDDDRACGDPWRIRRVLWGSLCVFMGEKRNF